MKVSSFEEAVARYGKISNGAWEEEAEWCTIVTVPKEIACINTATGRRADHIYCNRDMAPALVMAFDNIVVRCLTGELKTFDGCFCIRDVRAEPGKPSAHSYALAIDINASTNKLGAQGDMSEDLGKCFTDAGFSWGKKFHRMDSMHFSFCWE